MEGVGWRVNSRECRIVSDENFLKGGNLLFWYLKAAWEISKPYDNTVL